MSEKKKVEPSLLTFPKSTTMKEYAKANNKITLLLEKDNERVQWLEALRDSEEDKQDEGEEYLNTGYARLDTSGCERLVDIFEDMGGPNDYFPYEFKAFVKGYLARGKEILGEKG